MKKIFVVVSLMAILLGACSHKTSQTIDTSGYYGSSGVAFGYNHLGDPSTGDEIKTVKMQPADSKPVTMIPNATAFRMSGNYSDNVAISLNPQGELTYFPAPSDITADSAPISLGDGWWLNCQGLGPNSVFTKYTFAEYSALPATPSPNQLKLDIIPGAKVTEFIELPMKLNEAIQNLDEVKAYLRK